MRTFTTIWLGQLVSTIGSYMTVFALLIWVWQQTESATTLALVTFFSQLPRIFITPIAGVIVDRFHRKRLMLLGDGVALLSTLVIGLLYITGLLQIWHLYLVVALYGCFGQLQTLAYSASIAMLVSKEHYTRAESMISMVGYSGAIFSPILAGSLYPLIGITGIIAIDLTTFFVAFVSLILSPIAQPTTTTPAQTTWQDLTFGIRYIATKPALIALMVAFTLFAIPSDIGKALYNPMILARSGGDAQVLGFVTTAAGVGGVIGAILFSVWGGFPRRIHGMLLGFTATGFFKLLLGLGQTPLLWAAAHFCATLPVPMFYSSSNAIWYAKVPPHLQGRVLAADQMIGLIVGAVAPLLAGPLADYVFEPAMQADGYLTPLFAPLFGSGTGAGIALLYTLTALWMLLVGIGGYGFPTLRAVETLLPDHDLPDTPEQEDSIPDCSEHPDFPSHTP
ncbi:MAG: MFS transporter [Synechococcales cyanobacterium M58_A2018_015]|nr:MFS transporter [Synechococcales cyanobacterium M58_A2018_015]